MTTRSVTRRNLVGGFWGGTLGILLFGYVHPALLPVGCFAGVIAGWWHQEMFSINTATIRGALSAGLTIFRLRWLDTDPTKAERVFFWSAVCSSALPIGLVWILISIYFFTMSFEQRSVEGIVTGLFFILFWIAGIFSFVLTIAFLQDTTTEVKLQKFTTLGTIRYFLHVLRTTTLTFGCFTLLLFSLALWTTVTGGIFLILVIIPTAAGFGLLKATFWAATQRGHWPCFFVTLVVTALAAWLFSPLLATVQVLWIVAVVTGLAAGAASEGARVCIIHLSERAVVVRQWLQVTYATHWHSYTTAFWNTAEKTADHTIFRLPSPTF